MSQGEKNVAYVATLLSIVLWSVPASRDFIMELAPLLAAMIWFGLLVVWNVIISIDVNVIIGVLTGLAFVGAVVTGERSRARNR